MIKRLAVLLGVSAAVLAGAQAVAHANLKPCKQRCGKQTVNVYCGKPARPVLRPVVRPPVVRPVEPPVVVPPAAPPDLLTVRVPGSLNIGANLGAAVQAKPAT